ncbi:MAG: PfkB family carbohydrate kinase [Coprothermobacterota bacterium]|nr:PfkB family carbohydrate kinase [Coprothermobacterota bacterium]
MNQLLVIGGASSDTLHVKRKTVPSAGGAGMYTAMAAHRCGAQVSLFAPCPSPMPELLKPVAERLDQWLGPVIPPEQLPHFEISYQGGRTEYIEAFFGAESLLSPEMLPEDLSPYEIVHVIPLGDAQKQLSFIEACRRRGAKRISAGTYRAIVAESAHLVGAIMQATDLFFMNESEAIGLFGSVESARTDTGKILFITLGADGACVIQGNYATFLPAVSSSELDPTGAGDTFCGSVLAWLMQGAHPIMAAQHAIPLAAQMIEHLGPDALFSDAPAPAIPADMRVQINHSQVQRVSRLLSSLEEASPFPFVSPELPPVHHPGALDYFFAATAQQFSFWTEQNNRYQRPLIAPLGGVMQKGAFYLFDAYRRRLEVDPGFCSPERQANLSRAELLAVFRSDDGLDPMPALDLHLETAQTYGRDMLALHLTPAEVVQEARASSHPLRTLIAKKSGLLALILHQRAESFLPFAEDEQVEPVIDYHLMRSCLRVGLIEVVDDQLKGKLIHRQVISPDEEWAVRFAAYRAIEQVVAASGKTTGAVDWLFFGARTRCPEMSAPECRLCRIDSVCAHRRELFQPVRRTSFY